MADPTWLPEVIRAAKIQVDILDGAFDRGNGDCWDLEGTMEHHTGSSGDSSPWGIAKHPTLGLCSQLFLPRRGKKVVLCGVGIAHHGGSGGGYPWIKNVNAQLTGMEMDNNGTEGWSQDQYWTGATVTAAILNKIKKPKERNIGHKEWAGKAQGKWDPGGMNMDKRRHDIGNLMAEMNGVKPEVPVIENQIDRIRFFSDWLGARLFKEERNAIRGGLYVDFEHGSVYWQEKLGAIAVPTLIYQVWEQYGWEQGFLGFPKQYHSVVQEEGVNVGDVQVFEGGTIYRKYGTPGYVTHGMIGDRYFAEGGQRGHLGWPTSNEFKAGEVIVQDFAKGQILCDLNGTVKVLRGDTIYTPPKG